MVCFGTRGKYRFKGDIPAFLEARLLSFYMTMTTRVLLALASALCLTLVYASPIPMGSTEVHALKRHCEGVYNKDALTESKDTYQGFQDTGMSRNIQECHEHLEKPL